MKETTKRLAQLAERHNLTNDGMLLKLIDQEEKLLLKLDTLTQKFDEENLDTNEINNLFRDVSEISEDDYENMKNVPKPLWK